MTINVNSVLTKGTRQGKWYSFILCLDSWHSDVCLWHLVPSLSLPLFPFSFSCYQLFTLLSCCWVCLYFSAFLFAASILLLEVPSYFISWNVQVSMIFLYSHHNQCWSAEKFFWKNVLRTTSSKRLFRQFFRVPPNLDGLYKRSIYSSCYILAFLRYVSHPAIIELTLS